MGGVRGAAGCQYQVGRAGAGGSWRRWYQKGGRVDLQTQSRRQMPFKLKLIKLFQKCLSRSQEGAGCKAEEGSEENPPARQKNKPKKKIIAKNANLYQLVLRKEPLQGRHVANFFNIIGINEAALRSDSCDESYFRTLFYLKNVKKIESRHHYLLLHLSDSSFHFPTIDYIVERFKSFGDSRFYVVANLMLDVAGRMQALQNLKSAKEKEENSQFIERYTDSLGARMFVCRISNNKMIISKSLLEQLEYDPQEFAIETLKFRTPLYEAASTEKYYDVIVKYFENLRNLLDLVSDRISLQTFLDSSVLRFRDYFYSKRNKKIYCKIKAGMPNPLVTIFELEEVISKTEEFPQNEFSRFSRSKEVEEVRQKIRRSEIKTVRPLMKLPKNFYPENEQKVAEYRELQQSA